jgi:hypothetical protein
MLDLPVLVKTNWKAGETATISWSIVANHGGGYSYRLCPSGGDQSEECFQKHTLEFVGDTQEVLDTEGHVVSVIDAIRTSEGTVPKGSTWTRNPFPMEKGLGPGIKGRPDIYGRGPFEFNLRDTIKVCQHASQTPRADVYVYIMYVYIHISLSMYI